MSALVVQLDELRRELTQQWDTVNSLRHERDRAADRELSALKRARQAERRLRELERQAGSADHRTGRSCQD